MPELPKIVTDPPTFSKSVILRLTQEQIEQFLVEVVRKQVSESKDSYTTEQLDIIMEGRTSFVMQENDELHLRFTVVE